MKTLSIEIIVYSKIAFDVRVNGFAAPDSVGGSMLRAHEANGFAALEGAGTLHPSDTEKCPGMKAPQAE